MSINSPPINSIQEPNKLFNDLKKTVKVEMQRGFAQQEVKQNCNLTDEFIPKEVILEKFKMSRGMYANLKKNGIIVEYRLGGKRYVKKSELLATLEKNKS